MANNNNRDDQPYQDPYNPLAPPNIFNFVDDPNPTLANIMQFGGPSTSSSANPQQNNRNRNGSGSGNEHGLPFQNRDVTIQDVANFTFGQGGNSEAGPSERHGGDSQPNPNGEDNPSGPISLTIWPEPPIPFLCSCCTLLREIIHTDGANIVRLEIHGRVGIISHALQQRTNNVGSSDSNQEYHMFDFCKKTIEEVKVFITDYFIQQTSSGYVLIQDPLSLFYEAICVGLHWTDFNDDLHHNSASHSEDMDAEDEVERPKISLAAQRERAGRMNLSHFRDYFHLPIEEAARHVNLSPTVVKKICRKEGLLRWPHRKVKSIARQISSLRKSLQTEIDEGSRAGILTEIARLQEEITQHCGGVSPSSIH